ncbi:MAG: glycosyltransferase family 39 protein [Candidatus Sumerlaeota bacterium]|nr:glycosyltransferase family 39 protein [Candidatus Sumerlaeota bacterium]
MDDKHSASRTWLKDAAVIFIIAAALRLTLFAIALPHPERFQTPDWESYYYPALNLARHAEFSRSVNPPFLPETFRTPGYPVFVMLIFLVFPPTISFVIFFQCLVGTAGCSLLYAVARGWWGRAGGWLAGLAAAANLSGIVNCMYFLSDGLYAFLVIGQIALWALYLRRRELRWVWAASAWLALMVLVRPVGMLWIVPQIVLLIVDGKQTWRRRAMAAVGGAAIFVLCLTPWMARNRAVGEGFTLTTIGGFTLYFYNVAAMESARTGVSAPTIREQWQAEMQKFFDADPKRFGSMSARSAYLNQLAKEKIREHPFLYAKVHLKPWALLPNINALLELAGATSGERGTLDVLGRQGLIAAARHYLQGRWGLLAICVPWIVLHGIILALDAVGCALLLWRRRWREFLAFLAFFYYYVFLVGPITLARYQEPAMPAAILTAVWAALELHRIRRERKATARA